MTSPVPSPQADTLLNAQLAGVYSSPSDLLSGWVSAASQLGFLQAHIDCTQVGSKEALLDAVSAALHFPDWFGHNWDALSDCLQDLSWLPAPGYLITFSHTEKLASTDAEAFSALIDVGRDAADQWRAAGLPFR